LTRQCQRPKSASIRRRQIPAFDLPRCARACVVGKAGSLGRLAGAGEGMAGNPGMAFALAQGGRFARRYLSARRQILSGLLSVRRPPCASDAWYAAYPASRTGAAEATLFCVE